MQDSPSVTTFLFTDIEGSTRLWEQDPERMRPALARHDAIVRAAVQGHHGDIVKMSGDGIHAAFADPLGALGAALQLQRNLSDPEGTAGIPLRVRCGLHAGVDERRDNDYFGGTVNRAARIMSAAHGGQVLLSRAVTELVRERLPAGVRLRDLGAVRLRDLAEPERVYQVEAPQLRLEFPALRSLEATPNNLPQQVTSFIGRRRELSEIKKLLANTRLLTLIGLGGIGKTRLSLQVAADVLDDYQDGVWFVELASLADPRMVPQAVASAVGVKEEAGHAVIEALVKHVKERRLLLILDNCEHLLQACAEHAKQLLQAGPTLTILASSREPLRVGGETSYPVPALAAPNPYANFIHTELSQYEAARLFIERALAAQPAFEVSEQNAAAIAEVCHRLDGIPLAIELAASRARALSVEAIAARLNDRFKLLTGGDRTTLPRQQTLRALIDWSHDLLTEPERVLLRRLAVFAGGWALEAAEAIGAADNLEQAEILDLLTQLVEKSLVTIDALRGRYRLLDTVRQYAQERLAESGEEKQMRDQHLAYYLALVEKARPELVGPQQGRWLAEIDRERENLLAAHIWCDRTPNGAEQGLRLVSSLKRYWMSRGLLGLACRLAEEALAREQGKERNLIRCRALFDAGQLSSSMGRYAEAQRYLEDSLAIAWAIGDKQRAAAALQPLALASLGQGDLVAARAHLQKGLALASELGDRRSVAAALNALAQLHRVEGDLDAAEPLYVQVLALARDLGDRESVAIGLLNLAMASIGRGSFAVARRFLLEVLAIVEEVGSKRAGQSALEVCAGLAAAEGRSKLAARFYGAAESQAQRTGLRRDPADEAFLAPLIAKAQDALGAPAFEVAEGEGRALADEEAIAEASAWLTSS